jgi:signal transduction histidine kinase
LFGYIRQLLDTRTLSPHGFCLLWRPELLWTHVVSDALIGLSYMTIPLSLVVILWRRRDIPFGGVVWCFALFITACGLTHFMSIVTLWRPIYGIEALVKVVTAAASMMTAVLLWRLIPLAVSLPSPAHLRKANRDLEMRVAERDLAIRELQHEREERARAEESLLQTQKLEALGQLTGGVAHDFNNLLQAVQGAFELIDRRAADVSRVQQLARDGIEAAQRGARLTAQLLAFARSRQLKPETFAIDDQVAGLHEMLHRTLESAIDLRFDLDAAGQCVLADRTQLELALLNLVINARDALESHGRIVIRTANVVVEQTAPDLARGRYVEVSVADNGGGMPEEVRAKAFDPFFTTKPVGKGTGLGLSQVYGFARQLGGAARIESREGHGATVSIYLPCVERPADLIDAPGPSDPTPVIVRGKILVVDDDSAVRRLAVDALEAMGHEVSQASDGVDALAQLDAFAPDLMVIDYAMPGMTGAQLAAEVRERRPDMKILFVTGYADVEAVQGRLGGDQTILRKPYHFETLVKAVNHALRRDG